MTRPFSRTRPFRTGQCCRAAATPLPGLSMTRASLFVAPLLLGLLATGEAYPADGRLGATSSATMRISLVVPRHAAALAESQRQGPGPSALARVCMSARDSAAFRLYPDSQARTEARAVQPIDTAGCLQRDRLARLARQDGLLVLEPE